MGPSKPNAVDHECPYSGNQTTANRNHLQRPGGTLAKREHAERCLERSIRPTNNHQTEMDDCRADEQSNDNAQRQKNNERYGSRACAHGKGKWTAMVRKQTERSKNKRVQIRDD